MNANLLFKKSQTCRKQMEIVGQPCFKSRVIRKGRPRRKVSKCPSPVGSRKIMLRLGSIGLIKCCS